MRKKGKTEIISPLTGEKIDNRLLLPKETTAKCRIHIKITRMWVFWFLNTILFHNNSFYLLSSVYRVNNSVNNLY